MRLVADGDQGWRTSWRRIDVAEVPAEAIASSAGPRGKGGFGPFWTALSTA